MSRIPGVGCFRAGTEDPSLPRLIKFFLHWDLMRFFEINAGGNVQKRRKEVTFSKSLESYSTAR